MGTQKNGAVAIKHAPWPGKKEMNITEIVKIPAGEIKVNKSDFPQYSDSELKKFKPLPGNSGFVYRVVPIDQETLYIEMADVDTKKRVGYLSLSKNHYFPMKNANYVELIAVDPERRGQGIAKALYGIYLSILKYPLLAGHDQTPGGRRNWLSLSQIPGVEVRGYIPINDRSFDPPGPNEPDYVKKQFDDLLDSVMAMGGEYLGKGHSKQYGTTHYFAFDVVPGTGELEAAVQTKLKLYGIPKLANPGLYAVWRGQ